MLSEPERAVGSTGLGAEAAVVVVAWRASTTCSDWRRAWEWLLLGEESELAMLGWVVCGGFFLRTEVRAADVSLVACCMLLRLSRLRRVPVRLITWTGEGGEVWVVGVAVMEDARVAVVVAAAVASAAQSLGDDIWRHGTRAAPVSLTPRLPAMLAITANQCVGPGGNGAVMQQAIMCLSKEDEVRRMDRCR